MAKRTNTGIEKRVQPRLRITCGDNVALGPGKAELLALLDQTGSIAEAAKRMGMSYMRAWTLIRTLNGCFKEPLVAPVRGGKNGGGATLTARGHEALALYQQMERDCDEAARTTWPQLARLLRD
jgi:molybdate transport system regulatory protein